MTPGSAASPREAGQVLVDALNRRRDHRGARDRPGLWQRDSLGCGHGVGVSALGIDISEGMVALAREHVPQATFRVESLLSAELPSCVAVAAVGECLNYLFDDGEHDASGSSSCFGGSTVRWSRAACSSWMWPSREGYAALAPNVATLKDRTGRSSSRAKKIKGTDS